MPKVSLKVPKLSGFDKSHQTLLTAKCGTLVPILVDEVIANTKVSLSDVISAKLPPLASDTFMRCNLKVEAFFVPFRLCYGGFPAWLMKETKHHPSSNTDYTIQIPYVNEQNGSQYLNNGSLADYLGVRTASNTAIAGTIPLNIFPFLAYHRIYHDFYRHPLINSPVFTELPLSSYAAAQQIPSWALPYTNIQSGDGAVYFEYELNDLLADGVRLGELRQRNFGFDYFTTALPDAQMGNAQSVSFSTSGSTGSFTIAALRAANSLQQFAERNQIAGTRWQDYLKANYGSNLSNGVAQRSIYLGSAEIPVYSKGVYQQSVFDGSSPVTNNPFEDSPGAQFGSATCGGQIQLIKDFTAEEPGIIMVLASLVPVVTYSSGIERMMLHYNAQNSQTDMANPILQNVGNQPIYSKELTGNANGSFVFGYNDRFAEYKYKNSSLHGLLRDGQTLAPFALQRKLQGNNVNISSSFLKIPTSYLDQVAAVSGTISNYGVWMDVFHNYKVAMPLAEYAIPSLQDPAYEHGNDVQVEIGGSRL